MSILNTISKLNQIRNLVGEIEYNNPSEVEDMLDTLSDQVNETKENIKAYGIKHELIKKVG